MAIKGREIKIGRPDPEINFGSVDGQSYRANNPSAAAGVRQATQGILINRLALEGASDSRERGVQVRAGGLHRHDNDNRDTGCDQTIFNGCRPGVVPKETRDKLAHDKHS